MLVDSDTVRFYSYTNDRYEFLSAISNLLKDREYASSASVDVDDFAEAFGVSDQISKSGQLVSKSPLITNKITYNLVSKRKISLYIKSSLSYYFSISMIIGYSLYAS